MGSNKTLPKEIVDLIKNGIWPTTEAMVLAQFEKSIVDRNDLDGLVDDEGESLIFYKPPFSTAEEWALEGIEILYDFCDTGFEIRPDKILVLGDLGPGSDAFWGLLYQDDISDSPLVVREYWDDSIGKKLGWKTMSENFEELCRRLNLNQ